ncbi:hypothetical protein [Bradyrhizobium sp. sBnM-33]|uniref:hypothetical protein n=1 Tax=Bradyrhizobium sp. sBnM-33 TaxID=2831780 RepID=UPI00293E1307|nr:hypothetical protein [Bradyrhizobium sp. sBnM-33]WOH52486.1 hypothetical protein RX328_10115 [Bradyrhizobium sp. sBnM-33]
MLQEMWARYELYADPDLRQGFARDVDRRFWEMYLRTLLPVVEGQREAVSQISGVIDEGRRGSPAFNYPHLTSDLNDAPRVKS